MKKLNKKIIIIICVVMLIIFAGIFLVLMGDKEIPSKVLSCSFSKNDFSLITYEVEIDALYTDSSSIDQMSGIVEFIINKPELLKNIDYIEGSVNEYYKKLEKSDAIDINVSKEKNKIIVNFEIDYTNNDLASLKNESFIVPNNDSLNEIPSVESLKESTLKSGGVCVEK